MWMARLISRKTKSISFTRLYETREQVQEWVDMFYPNNKYERTAWYCRECGQI